MADLFTDLVSKRQRETAGSDSASRFDYQKDWAFCQMLRKQIDGEDYLIAFEFHDDVLILAPSGQPTRADFFQVKTSSTSKPRTMSSITTRPGGKSSIVGKMFANFDGICSSHDVKVVLVSNNAFEFSDKALCAKDLEEKLRNRLLGKLSDEIEDFDEARLDKLHFLVTGVTLESMQSFLEGEAMELFCSKFGEDHGLNIRTWIRLIKSEITRRNNYPSNDVADADELISKKCIGSSFIEETLTVIHKNSKKLIDVTAISEYLRFSGLNFNEVLKFQKKIPEASADYYNIENSDVKYISQKMKNLIDFQEDQLIDALDKFITDISSDEKVDKIYKSSDYIRALGAIVYYDNV